MSSQLRYILYGVALCVVGGLSFLVGRITHRIPEIKSESVRVDTLFVRDTITCERPVYTRVTVRDTIPYIVRDTIVARDTVFLPREVKVYEDGRYRAEVSGYEPSLDRIDIFVQERVVTKNVTKVVKVKRNARWGVGLQVGYGMTVQPSPELRPYIGVGVSYNLLTF